MERRNGVARTSRESGTARPSATDTDSEAGSRGPGSTSGFPGASKNIRAADCEAGHNTSLAASAEKSGHAEHGTTRATGRPGAASSDL